MRVAIVSDIHGNLTAFEAVLEDLRQTSPDLILHGGDLADGGARPAEIVDRVRDLGWKGVVGNTDELLFSPESLTEFARQSAASLKPVFDAVEEMAAATREKLGAGRLGWLGELPRGQNCGSTALIHATPESLWRAPAGDALDAELESAFALLRQRVVVYAHVHCPYVRSVAGMTIANSGSVGLPYDGDRRASYLLIDGTDALIRRVEYDLDRELKELSVSGLPHAGWIARMLEAGRPQMP